MLDYNNVITNSIARMLHAIKFTTLNFSFSYLHVCRLNIMISNYQAITLHSYSERGKIWHTKLSIWLFLLQNSLPLSERQLKSSIDLRWKKTYLKKLVTLEIEEALGKC